MKITDIPLAQLKSLHALDNPSVDRVKEVLDSQFHEFAEQISDALSGDKVDHPELAAEELNAQAAAQAEAEAAAQAEADAAAQAAAQAEADAAAQAAAQAAQAADQQAAEQPTVDQPAAGSDWMAGLRAGMANLAGKRGATGDSASDAPDAAPAEAAPQPEKKLSFKEKLAKQRAEAARLTEVHEEDFEADITADDFTATYLHQASLDRDNDAIKYKVEIPETADDADAEELPAEHRHPIRFWWPHVTPEPGQLDLYRIVAADEEMQMDPEAGDTLMVTRGFAYRDTNPGSAGLRHYVVWKYSGDEDDPEGILGSQPEFIGELVIVFPPINVSVQEAQGEVVATWDLQQGHSATRVYKFRDGARDRSLTPSNEVTPEPGGRRAKILAEDRGQELILTFIGEVNFNGEVRRGSKELSVERRVHISSELMKMKMRSCEMVKSHPNDQIKLQWIAPRTGQVNIYLTQKAPDVSLVEQGLADRAFIDDEFDNAIIAAQGSDQPGLEREDQCVWPAGWHQVYVTPVNVDDNSGWIGESMVLQRVQSIPQDNCRLIERVNSQLITFDWPQGAQMVEVTRQDGTSVELLQDDYNRQGGIRMNLQSLGDEVTLRPKAIYGGQYTLADEPTVLKYEGITQFTYDVTQMSMMDGTMGVFIWAVGTSVAAPPPFMVVYNPDRLPLYPGDGEVVQPVGGADFLMPGQLGTERPAAPQCTVQMPNAAASGGFFRLFVVDQEDEDYDTEDMYGADSFDTNDYGDEEDFEYAEFTQTKNIVVEYDVANRLDLRVHINAGGQGQ